ncbi:MAG TPA: ATP-binding protein [Marmoricola sp.]|nr:ATP-binding protein [Marmoricola sp.]
MRTQLPGDLHAPSAARAFVADAFEGEVGARETPETHDVVLVVSELVTNSVRAGADVIGVELVATDLRVELSVIDDAPGVPVTQHPGWDELHGRGLAIVEDVADEWHTTALDRGKKVTATWSRPAGRQVR